MLEREMESSALTSTVPKATGDQAGDTVVQQLKRKVEEYEALYDWLVKQLNYYAMHVAMHPFSPKSFPILSFLSPFKRYLEPAIYMTRRNECLRSKRREAQNILASHRA